MQLSVKADRLSVRAQAWADLPVAHWQPHGLDTALQLAPNSIHCWRFDLTELPPAPAASNSLLTGAERMRVVSYADARARQFGWSRHYLRMLLQRYLGRADLAISTSASGKPQLTETSYGLHFSLSHTGSQLLIALADQAVGVDLEALDRLLSQQTQLRIAQRLGLTATDSQPFIVQWTQFEAQQKCSGAGVFGAQKAAPYLTSVVSEQAYCISLASQHKQVPQVDWFSFTA